MTSPDQPPNSKMEQTNRENAKGWQTDVKGGTANIADHIDITNNYYPDKLRRTGKPFQVQPLPPHFVARSEYENPLKAELLREDAVTPGILLVSAIHGLGGIGKTILATKLAHDDEIQERFADGILWVTLGQKPDLLPQLNDWIEALGDHDYRPTTLNAASTHLRTLLYGKAVLLVVDDAWDAEHVKWFRIGSDRCRLLITTRRADVADEADAKRFSLELMTPEQSLELLSARLGRPLVGAEWEAAQQLTKAVGYLPIALDLVAARIARGVPWAKLYKALDGEIARLEALEGLQHRRKGETRLEACFNLSLTALKEEIPDIWGNFIWLGVLPEDVLITAPLVATLWQVDGEEVAERLELLWNDALLLTGPEIVITERTYPTYRIHDLLHDIACYHLIAEPPKGLGLTLPAAQRELLERYRVNTQQGQWHTLPDDGYIHAHLTWHLEKAEQLDILHQLLQETTPEGRNGWYEACERLGQTANFVTDVARAWQVAEQQYEQNPSEAIGLQLRYALITTTLNSLAKNIPAELMAGLVKNGFWTPAQGLAYAQQTQGSQRAAILKALAEHLPSTLLPIALKLAREIQSESNRAEALRGLAPYLPAALWPEALAVAREIQHESDRAWALRGLAPYLPAALWPKALAVAREIQHESDRAKTLSGLAAYLPEVIPEALAVAREIQSESNRAEALRGLAPYLPAALWPEALAVAREIQSESNRAEALRGLAPYLPAALWPEALAVAREIQSESDRTEALSGLAPYLQEVIPEALAAAREIQNEYSRARALSDLAPYLPAALLPEALAVAREIQSESDRAYTLSGLAPYLPAALWPKALAVAREIQSESDRAYTLSGLAAYLPEVIPEALAVAREIQSESDRTEALSGLAPYLQEVIPEALAVAAAREIQSEYYRASALSDLAPYLPALWPEALAVAREIQHEHSRAYKLSGLAPYLPASLWPEALAMARELQSESDRAKTLSGLAPYLPASLWPEALAMARELQNESDRAKTLSGLAPYLPASLWPEALAVARELQNESDRASALSDLASYLPAALWPEALAMAREIQSEYSRVSALSGLAPYLPEVIPEAWAVAREIQDNYSRAKTLRDLAPYLPAALWPEALAMAREIQDECYRTRALSGLAPYLPIALWPEALAVAFGIQSEYSHASALSDLAPYLPAALWPEALAMAREIQDKYSRAKTLRDLAPYLPAALWPEALAMAREIQDESDRAYTLSDLASYLPAALWPEVLAVAREIQDKYSRAKMLRGFLPRIDWESVNLDFWCEIIHTLSWSDRSNFIQEIPQLAPGILALGDKAALAAVVVALREVCEQW